METAITYTLGENTYDELPQEDSVNFERLPGYRVLLVDDNETNRVIMREILLEHGLLVEEAGNGKIAVDKIANSKPGDYDLLLGFCEWIGYKRKDK